MNTATDWARRLAESEQRIVNIAFGWATATTPALKAEAADRLYGEVWAHHRMLGEITAQRPTMPYEVAEAKARKEATDGRH